MRQFRDDPYRLTPELLLRAYAAGIFPMAESRHDRAIFWVDPRRRGIIPLDRFHVPRKLQRLVRRGVFEVRVDTACAEVIAACAEPGPGRRDTWINAEIERAYLELHRLGFVHSVEAWRERRLVGGLYGVALGGAFFGESMYSREADASKVALVHLVERLKAGGFRLLDTQFVTDHLRRFGAIEIPTREYLLLLEDALSAKAVFPLDPASTGIARPPQPPFSQSSSQTS
jgi:leucyl/phenylalanyl-tRNA--protein transferase